ncbi:hypothetical protein PM10SUCC1_28970 [Propionigenium maris DSM 9537]|uniref:Uncharacterized protein n=1 Tax=Propionigenium maris DSM 9537 TaxID=1123000 RepID=A0A9W6GLN7_9FUSO|nr:hypothetical protein [Propionigenium maris]GLI57383.1 hypothetical protein PM10SUCC1_28970 [Propionigenium maris DSM 9537]
MYKYYVITEKVNGLKGVLLREGYSLKSLKSYKKTGKEINDLFYEDSCSEIRAFRQLSSIKPYYFHQIEVNELRGVKKKLPDF